MAEFWEEAFKDKQEMRGLEPAASTVLTHAFFVAHGVKNMLIPGIGYGRNPKPGELSFPFNQVPKAIAPITYIIAQTYG